MKKGLIVFHQGFSDIISCLPLVNYYSKTYEQLSIIIREDFKETVDFYLKGLPNVNVLYFDINRLRKYLNPSQLIDISDDTDKLFHGSYDAYRNENDPYRLRFNESIFYGVGFYEFYGINVMEKIQNFTITRDFESEDILYQSVIKDDDDFIVYHENNINKVNKSTVYRNINLDSISSNLFNTIKLLEKAKEIHVVDSVWSILCYLLDTKYGLFKDKKVYIYPFKERSGSCIWFKDKTRVTPFKPENWIIV